MFSDRVLDTVHIASGMHALYHYVIDMHGNSRGALEENVIWYVARCRYPVDVTEHLLLQEHEGGNLHGFPKTWL